MVQEQIRKNMLPLSERLEVMVRLINGTSFDDLIHRLSNDEIVLLQKFMWNKTVEIGLRLRGGSFTRKDITKRMISTPAYQRKQGCSERVYYCKGVMCIHSNSACATNKIKGHIEAMQAAVRDWLDNN